MKKNLFLVAVMSVSGLPGCADHPQDAQTDETAQELASSDADFECYSDDTYTTMVGYYYRTCSGASALFGRRTSFIIGSTTTCQTNVEYGCWQLINDVPYCFYDYCAYCF